jgi:hypothetical protein
VADADYSITNNQFTAPIVGSTGTGVEIGDRAGNPLINFNLLTISNNQFTGLGNKPIGGAGYNGKGTVIIDSNTFSQSHANTNPPSYISFGPFGPSANIVMSVTNNVWENSQSLTANALLMTTVSPTAKICLSLQSNRSDATGVAYNLDNSGGGTFTANVANNIGTVQELGTITSGACP